MAPESSLSEVTRAALNNSQVIDLTTTGRRTGQLRRIEIFLHNDLGQLFITGMPRADRTRDWIYNVEADPKVVIHLKQSVVADVPATARVVTDPTNAGPSSSSRPAMGSHGRSGHAPAQPAHRAYPRPLLRPSDRLVAARHRTRQI
jgi:deazaflavin-dependent oxidoreductase (nitroreductase family)